MILHVKLHGPSASGIPEDWPALCAEASDDAPAPEGWLSMTPAEYSAYRADADRLSRYQASLPAPVKTDEEIYAEKLAEGYLDPVLGIRLKTVETAQTKFTSQFTLLSGAVQAGQLSPTTPTKVWDYNDQPHDLIVEQVQALLLRYGFHCNQLFAQYGP